MGGPGVAVATGAGVAVGVAVGVGVGVAPGTRQTGSPVGVEPASTRRPRISVSWGGMPVPRGQSEDHAESHSREPVRAATAGPMLNAPWAENSLNGAASGTPSTPTRRPHIS